MVAETSGDAVVYKYVRGAGLLYAENAADEKTWYVKDAHGDTVQLTDGNGNIVWNYAYDAFGNQKETVHSGTEPYNPFRYTGEYFDAETGFIYLRARYMDPQTGRFISEDPVGDGVNWYVYAAGNPVMLFDPSGLAVTDWDKKHCSFKDIQQLEALTNEWNAANENGNTQIMNFVHDRAEQIRDKYRAEYEYGTESGNTIVEAVFAPPSNYISSYREHDLIVGRTAGTKECHHDALYAVGDGPQLKNGVEFGSLQTGMVRLEGESKHIEWNVTAVSGDVRSGITVDYIGVQAGARLVSGEVTFKISEPFTNHIITIGVEGELFGIGFRTYWDKAEGRLKVGLVPVIGGSISLGVRKK